MDHAGNNFQLVILECPYEIWDQPLVQTLFAKMVLLKRRGYGHNYQNHVLPVDTSDYIATHVLLCTRDTDGSFTPVMGLKSISLKICTKYKLNFPGLGLVQSAKKQAHIEVVESIIKRCEDQKKGLAYFGSWTIDTDFKKTYYQKNKDLVEAVNIFYFALNKEQNISEVILGGTLRFHTERFFQTLGQRPIAMNGDELEPINVVHLDKEPVVVMHGKVESSEVLILGRKKWQKIWNDRIHMRGIEEELKVKKAA